MEKKLSAPRLPKLKTDINRLKGIVALVSTLVLNSCGSEPKKDCECIYLLESGDLNISFVIKKESPSDCDNETFQAFGNSWYLEDKKEGDAHWHQLSEDVKMSVWGLDTIPRISSRGYELVENEK